MVNGTTVKKTSLILGIVLFLSLSLVQVAQAGFGISNPHIWAENLVPGSHYEHIITLTRGDPVAPVKVIVEVDAPDIRDWVSIDKGEEFIYPAGLQQYPMTVNIDVPEDAGYGIYRGDLTIKIAPPQTEGQVAIAVGALADFYLRVSGDEYTDFKVRSVGIPDFEEGWPLTFTVDLKNIGNVKIRPTKVHLEVFDTYHKERLAVGDITAFSWVQSFKTGNSEGEFNIKLSPGQYWAEYEVYKNDEIILDDKIRFYVREIGTLRPKSIPVRIKEFTTATPLRLMLTTFFGTIILVGAVFGIIYRIRKKKKIGLGK